MNTNDEKVRAAIAEEAGEWFVASQDGGLDAGEAEALAAWLKTSPVHIEEFLGVSSIARDLRALRTDAEYSIDAILVRARAEDGTVVERLHPAVVAPVRDQTRRRRLVAVTIAMAACVVLGLSVLFVWNVRFASQPTPAATAVRFQTRHGEQMTRRLADDSVLHLDTDSAVTIRFGDNERLVTLDSGQADFEVAHDATRAFRVVAGAAQVVDIGTQFDVRLEQDATVITVVEGQVAVRPALTQNKYGSANLNRPQSPVPLGPDQQLRVAQGQWPATPIAVDAQRTTSWMRREVVFDHEPLEQIAAEYNRYAPKPIEITTPALKNLEISGTFATDDPDAFIAFLRSLKGVRVKVTATEIRVSGD
jgi:transmembrane sensor